MYILKNFNALLALLQKTTNVDMFGFKLLIFRPGFGALWRRRLPLFVFWNQRQAKKNGTRNTSIQIHGPNNKIAGEDYFS